MSIAGRLVQEQHSSGVQCGGCLNQDASRGLKDSQNSRWEEYLTQGRNGAEEDEKRGERGKGGKGEGERSLAPRGAACL